MRLAVVSTHPIQYHAPIFRELARRLDLEVFFAHRATAADQARAGFGVGFDWDVDLLSGFPHSFLRNVSAQPGVEGFGGCDTPEIGERLRAGRFDALLVMGWHSKTFWQATWAAKRAGIPVMVRGDSHLGTPRGPAKRLAKRLVYPAALRAFDAALYVGERSREYWLHYHYPERRLFHSPHCVDNQWFAERATAQAGRDLRAQHGISPAEKVLLFAGKLIPLKRPGDVIAAAAMRPKGTGCSVLVAGDGPLGPSLDEAAQAAGVRLVRLGFCNQRSMPAVYAAADALVLSSDRETWGLVANEAIACGCPVIVSDAAGCSPEMAGFFGQDAVYPAGDVTALAGRIAALLAAPPSAAWLQRAADRLSVGAAADGICAAAEAAARRPSAVRKAAGA